MLSFLLVFLKHFILPFYSFFLICKPKLQTFWSPNKTSHLSRNCPTKSNLKSNKSLNSQGQDAPPILMVLSVGLSPLLETWPKFSVYKSMLLLKCSHPSKTTMILVTDTLSHEVYAPFQSKVMHIVSAMHWVLGQKKLTILSVWLSSGKFHKMRCSVHKLLSSYRW